MWNVTCVACGVWRVACGVAATAPEVTVESARRLRQYSSTSKPLLTAAWLLCAWPLCSAGLLCSALLLCGALVLCRALVLLTNSAAAVRNASCQRVLYCVEKKLIRGTVGHRRSRPISATPQSMAHRSEERCTIELATHRHPNDSDITCGAHVQDCRWRAGGTRK
jgi:hypothetical protein